MQPNGIDPASPLHKFLSVILWPGLFAAAMAGCHFAFASAHPIFWFNVVYLASVAVIGLFERLMPYEPSWLEPDGETFNNIAHTAITKGLTQIAAAVNASFPMLFATFAQPAIGTSMAPR